MSAMSRNSSRTIIFDGPAPEIVCVTGESRFDVAIAEEAENLEMAGALVIHPVIFSVVAPAGTSARRKYEDRRQEQQLRRIDMCDRLVAVCPQGIMSLLVKDQIEYAKAHQVPVQIHEESLGGSALDEEAIERLAEVEAGYGLEGLAESLEQMRKGIGREVRPGQSRGQIDSDELRNDGDHSD